MLRFVIVGTGRSGSGYISQVLTAAGINCGHEDYYRPPQKKPPASDMLGDSSWLATVADELPGAVFHQVRHPVKVLASFAQEVDPLKVDSGYYEQRTSLFEPTGDRLIDAMRCFVAFHDRAEHVAERTWRVEDVDANLIHEIAKRIGVTVDTKQLERALHNVPTDYNRRTHRSRLALSSYPDTPERRRIESIVRRHGYE